MLFPYSFLIHLGARALPTFVLFAMWATLSGCASIDVDEVPVEAPAWATVDLRTTNPDQLFDEPFDVWFAAVKEDGTHVYQQVGVVVPPGSFTFDTSSVLPDSVLGSFVDTFLTPSGDTEEIRYDALEFTPSDAAPQIQVADLFEFGLRPSPLPEPNESSVFPYALTTQPNEEDIDEPFVVMIYSDRAVEVGGVAREIDSSGNSGSLIFFDLELESGYNLVRVLQEPTSDGNYLRFDSDLRGETITWTGFVP